MAKKRSVGQTTIGRFKTFETPVWSAVGRACPEGPRICHAELRTTWFETLLRGWRPIITSTSIIRPRHPRFKSVSVPSPLVVQLSSPLQGRSFVAPGHVQSPDTPSPGSNPLQAMLLLFNPLISHSHEQQSTRTTYFRVHSIFMFIRDPSNNYQEHEKLHNNFMT
jgi:hypothetical protein